MKVTGVRKVKAAEMSWSFVARRLFCAAAETAASPASTSRWERLKNSKAGEKLTPASDHIHGGYTRKVFT